MAKFQVNSRSSLSKDLRAMAPGDVLKVPYKFFDAKSISARVSEARKDGDRDFHVDTKGSTYGIVTRIK